MSEAKTSPKSGFPIPIASWPCSPDEIVQINLDEFRQQITVDIRTWWKDRTGVLKPKRNGLSLHVSHLPKLSRFINDALLRVQMFGLLEEGRELTSPLVRRRR
jgi:hypothetical protein